MQLLEFHGTPENSTEFHGMPWNSLQSMEFNRIAWNYMEFNEIQWNSIIEFHRFQGEQITQGNNTLFGLHMLFEKMKRFLRKTSRGGNNEQQHSRNKCFENKS